MQLRNFLRERLQLVLNTTLLSACTGATKYEHPKAHTFVLPLHELLLLCVWATAWYASERREQTKFGLQLSSTNWMGCCYSAFELLFGAWPSACYQRVDVLSQLLDSPLDVGFRNYQLSPTPGAWTENKKKQCSFQINSEHTRSLIRVNGSQ